jgi:hypothetical protein
MAHFSFLAPRFSSNNDDLSRSIAAVVDAQEIRKSASKRYWMSPHVSACATSNGIVLLDLVKNRYFGLPEKEAQVLYSIVHDWPEPLGAKPVATDSPSPDFANGLLEAGVLTTNPIKRHSLLVPVNLTGVLTSVGEELIQNIPINTEHVMRFAQAWLWARRSARIHPLQNAVRTVTDLKARRAKSTTDSDEQRLVELVCVFRRLRPFVFTAHKQCLLHALALVRFLSYYDTFPVWVIGVKTSPWGAHSWVQHGNLVLDTVPEKVFDFTPILAV